MSIIAVVCLNPLYGIYTPVLDHAQHVIRKLRVRTNQIFNNTNGNTNDMTFMALEICRTKPNIGKGDILYMVQCLIPQVGLGDSGYGKSHVLIIMCYNVLKANRYIFIPAARAIQR